MSGGEFAAIEARANAADDSRGPIEQAVMYRIEPPPSFFDHISASQRDVRDLLAAVRERDNTIAQLRRAANRVYRLVEARERDLRYSITDEELRAALDPQETP